MQSLADRLFKAWIVGALLLALAACRQGVAPPIPAPPAWQEDIGPLLEAVGETRTREWLQALQRQCSARSQAGVGLCTATADLMSPGTGWDSIRHRLRERLGWQCAARGLLTGYYEPVLKGSLKQDRPGQVPLYGLEGEALRAFQAGAPWLTRGQIENRSPASDLRPLLWLDDPVEAFFLHIQGSGRVLLRDEGGRLMRVGYAGHNGQPYRAIGALMVERGWLISGQVSAQAIKQWLRAQLEGDASMQAQAQAVMHENPRYVFFRALPASLGVLEGPPGSMGLPLTAMASVAADPNVHAPGSALILLTAGSGARLVQVQDVGSAIKGEGRIDLFTGTGEAPGELAGQLKEPLRIIRIAPRTAISPQAQPSAERAARAQSDSAIALANCSAGM